MKAVARYSNRERWIVFLMLALVPSLLAATFFEGGVEAGGNAGPTDNNLLRNSGSQE